MKGFVVVMGLLLCAAAAQAQDLTGTWNVTSKAGMMNTCGVKTTNTAQQWLVSQNGPSFTVKVTGMQGFSELTGQWTEELAGRDGKISGYTVVLQGSSDKALGSGFASVHAGSSVELTSEGDTFSGRRFLVNSKPRAAGGTELCLVEFVISGKRQ